MLKKFALILTIVASLAIVSCSDDDNKKDNTPETITVPADQQAAVTEQTTGQLNTMIDQVDQLGQAMEGEGIYKKDAKDGKNPPAGWEAVSDGWYRYTNNQYEGYDLQVRYTPDIWSSVTPDYSLITKYEYKYTYKMTETYYEGYVLTWDLAWNAWAQWENPEKTFIKGANSLNYLVDYDLDYNGQVINYDWSYKWDLDYDGVSVDNNDKTAHFNMACRWPFDMDPQTYEYKYTDLTGEFKFAANGSGNLGPDANQAGWLKSNGTIFAKFYHDGTHAYYAVSADNYATHYGWFPWGVKK